MVPWKLLGSFVNSNFIRLGRTITSRRSTPVGDRKGPNFRRRHRLETLEDRRLLTNYIVDTLIDDPLATHQPWELLGQVLPPSRWVGA